MTKRIARFIPCLAGLLVLACTGTAPPPHAQAGRLDLSQWDFSAGSVELSGTWSVCWGQLLAPGADCPSDWREVEVRGLWSDDSARSPFGGKGVATYRLRLRLPPSEDALWLHAGAPMTAYRLWIDGAPQGGIGTLGATAAATSSDPRRNRVFTLPRASGERELWVQLANFEFRGGGIRRPWLVGRPETIQAIVGRGLLRDVLLFAISGVVGLAYLMQFALRPRESARGYFGLFALVIAMRSVPGSISDFAQLLVPWASFAGLTRFEYLGTALSIVAGAGYFLVKVPRVMPPRTMRVLQLAGLALSSIALLAPFPWVLDTLPLFLVLPPLVLALVLVCYGRAWWRGTPGVAVTLAASLVFLAAVFHDVIRAGVTDFGLPIELFPYFIVVWLLAEAWELAQVFHRTFARVESLSGELAEANFELQETEAAVTRFVPFDFLTLLGKSSVREVETGDHVRAELCVLHCDVQLDDAASFDRINALVRRLEPCITHNGGFVNEYRGEGLQALFPDPAAAVHAAREILEAVRGSAVGIGIETGMLLLGTLGEEERMIGGVIGDAVPAAEQLAARTRGRDTRLLVGAGTRDALAADARFALRELPGSEGAAAYEVLDAS